MIMEPEAYGRMAAAERWHWWFVGRRRILDAVIGTLGLPAGAHILEIGAGTGGNIANLQRAGTVTAIELDDAAREIARTRSGIDVAPGALPDRLGLGGQTFDLICLFDVLEHVGPDVESLRALRDHLGPHGQLILTVPAYRALYGPHDAALHHFRRYERAALAQKLHDTGYQVDYLTFFNMFLLPLALVARITDLILRRRAATGERLPPVPLNATFRVIFGAEAGLLARRYHLPCGLSLLAVARKAG
jgi:SAM-dependent methyltransferase